MKKVTSYLLVLFLLLGGVTARAQDTQIANHLALGISLGLDGIGLEVALPLSPYVQARAGYSFFPYKYSNELDFGSFEIGGKIRDLSKTPFTATIWKGGTGKLLFDIYPWPKISLHFTAGAYMGSGKLLSASADLSKVLAPQDYATLAITYGEGSEKIRVSTDKKGVVHADGKIGSFLPYVGLGFGRAVTPDDRVRVSFDMGVLITGGLKLQSYNYLRNEKGDPAVISSKYLVDEYGKQMDDGWVDRISSIPVFPMLKLNVFVRIF